MCSTLVVNFGLIRLLGELISINSIKNVQARCSAVISDILKSHSFYKERSVSKTSHWWINSMQTTRYGV